MMDTKAIRLAHAIVGTIPPHARLRSLIAALTQSTGGALLGVLLVTIWPASSTMQNQKRLAEAVTSAAARATEMLGDTVSP